MKNLKLVVAVLFMSIFILACNNTEKKPDVENKTVVDTHSAQTSLDWQGTYSEILPCADCEGIATQLTLKNDLSYVLISQYLGEENQFSDTLEGKFKWMGSNIQLEGIDDNGRSNMYKVEENQVRFLDKDSKVITGDLENAYILKKEGNLSVENKRWQLVELFGKKIEGSAETHYIIFHSENNKIEAKANCNILSKDYKITNQLQLKIEPGISTLMACEDNIEQEFSKMLSTVDNLSVNEETLTLNKARMAPLAKFILVKE